MIGIRTLGVIGLVFLSACEEPTQDQLNAIQGGLNMIIAMQPNNRGAPPMRPTVNTVRSTPAPSLARNTPIYTPPPIQTRTTAPVQRRAGIPSTNCLSVWIDPSSTAFFKGRITSNCSLPVWVAYCERALCGQSANFYNSAVVLNPGQSEPVDTRGQGISVAACVYRAPEYHTPRRLGQGYYC